MVLLMHARSASPSTDLPGKLYGMKSGRQACEVCRCMSIQPPCWAMGCKRLMCQCNENETTAPRKPIAFRRCCCCCLVSLASEAYVREAQLAQARIGARHAVALNVQRGRRAPP